MGPGCKRVAERNEAARRIQGRAFTQSRGVVLELRGFPGCGEEGRVTEMGHGVRAVSLGGLCQAARAGRRVETLHADERRAGAVRVPASAYVLQPHRPASVFMSA